MKNFDFNKELKFGILQAGIFSFLTCLCLNVFLSPPDTASYYSVARSFVIDFNQDFSNEFENFNFPNTMFWVTPGGYFSNDWPIGTGLLLSPFLFLAHLFAKFLNLINLINVPIKPDGYSSIYQVFTSAGMVFIALIGLWVCFKFVTQFVKPGYAFFSVLLVAFGSPIAFYLFYANFMSHIPGFTFVSLFIYVWGRHHIKGGRRANGEIQENIPQDASNLQSNSPQKRSQREWAFLGFLLGVSTIIRPQNIIAGSVFLPEIIMNKTLNKNFKNLYKEYSKDILTFILFFLVGFFPQNIFWGKIYGSTLQFPKIDEMDWFRPHLFSMIFSDYHGILLWTPILIFSLPGLILLFKSNRIIGAGLILFLILEFYTNASNKIWWASGSLGNRRFLDASIIFIVGLAMLISNPKSRLLYPLIILSTIWTIFLVTAERARIITLEHYEPWNKQYFLNIISNFTGAPFKTIKSLCGSFGDASVALRIASSIGLFFFASATIFLWEKLSAGKYVKQNLIKYSGFWIIVFWIIIVLIFVPAVITTSPPDLSKTLTQLNYTCVSLWHNYYEMGYFYLSKRDFKTAEEAFLKAINLVPTNPIPYRYLAVIFFDTQRPARAIQYCEKAIELFPEYQQAKEELLLIYGEILKNYPYDITIKKKFERLKKELNEAGQFRIQKP